MYYFLLCVIYLVFISLGLPDSLLGSAWPVMHIDFTTPISYMGIVSILISGSTIVSSLVSEKVTRKFGTRNVTLFSIVLTSLSMFAFSFANNIWILCVLAIPYGLGAGAIDAAINNYVAIHYNSKHMSWLHCFWGVGALISPYIMSYALTTSVWRDGYRIVGVLQLIIAIVVLLTIPLWKINAIRAEQIEEKSKTVGLREVFGIKGAVNIITAFCGYMCFESTTMIWASSYLVDVREIGEETAAAYASLFFIGISVGRFFGGFITDKLGDKRMIRLGCVIIFVGVVSLMLPVSTDISSLVGFVLIGLGCAPVYPCIIHMTPSLFGEDKSAAVIGIEMAMAYVGSTFAPPVFGLLGEHVSMKLLPLFILSFLLLMQFALRRTYKATGK